MSEPMLQSALSSLAQRAMPRPTAGQTGTTAAALKFTEINGKYRNLGVSVANVMHS